MHMLLGCVGACYCACVCVRVSLRGDVYVRQCVCMCVQCMRALVRARPSLGAFSVPEA
jgi:hypothetical protein